MKNYEDARLSRAWFLSFIILMAYVFFHAGYIFGWKNYMRIYLNIVFAYIILLLIIDIFAPRSVFSLTMFKKTMYGLAFIIITAIITLQYIFSIFLSTELLTGIDKLLVSNSWIYYFILIVIISTLISGIVNYLLILGLKKIVSKIEALSHISIDLVLKVVYTIIVYLFSLLTFLYSFVPLFFRDVEQPDSVVFFYLLPLFIAITHKQFYELLGRNKQ